MRRLILAAGLALSLATVPLPTASAVVRKAATPTPTPTPAVDANSNLPTPTPKLGALSAADQAAHLQVLKTHGDAEITRRLTSLNAAVTAVGKTTKLTASDKTTLTSQLQAEISGLTALKTKLDAETTLDGARADVQSIFDDYRVFALMLPKVRLIVVDDNFLAVGDAFNTLALNLGSKINTAKAAGKDVTSVQATLTDMEAKLGDAHTKYFGLADKIINLSPSDYNANHALLGTDRDALTAARADFKSARADATLIIAGLKSLKAASPSPSASPAK